MVYREHLTSKSKSAINIVPFCADREAKGLFIWRRASPVSGLARFTEILALHTFFVKKLIEFIWLGGLARLPRSRLAMPRSRQAGWKNSHIKHAIPVTGLKIIILRMSSSLIMCIGTAAHAHVHWNQNIQPAYRAGFPI